MTASLGLQRPDLLRQGYVEVALSRNASGTIDVLAAINGCDARLVVDTGAARSAVALESAERFGLTLAVSNARMAGIGTANQTVHLATISDLGMGASKLSQVEVLVTSQEHVNAARRAKGFAHCDGVLGGDLLAALAAIIDYRSGFIYLRASAVNPHRLPITRPTERSPNIEVLPAAQKEAAVLANLFELYAYDFSEILPLKLGADGRFGYEPLPLYWQEAHRFPFLVRANGDLAGFALVQRGSQVSAAADVWDMAEFFVLRGYRRHGVGLRAAQAVWKMFPGPWEVRVLASNAPALAFWRRAVSDFVARPSAPTSLEAKGEKWHVFAFHSA